MKSAVLFLVRCLIEGSAIFGSLPYLNIVFLISPASFWWGGVILWECMMTNNWLFDLVVKFSVSSILSDSFFLSDRDSFEICSSSSRRTLLALAVHQLLCCSHSVHHRFHSWYAKVKRFRLAKKFSSANSFNPLQRRLHTFWWQKNSAPQTLSTPCREDCLHFGGIHS